MNISFEELKLCLTGKNFDTKATRSLLIQLNRTVRCAPSIYIVDENLDVANDVVNSIQIREAGLLS